MGLLDDAIREHLDLKRRRGADPEEIERAEREALGPVRRGPEEPPPAETEGEEAAAYDHEADYGHEDEPGDYVHNGGQSPYEDEPDWDDPFNDEEDPFAETGGGRGSAFDLSQPAPGEPEHEPPAAGHETPVAERGGPFDQFEDETSEAEAHPRAAPDSQTPAPEAAMPAPEPAPPSPPPPVEEWDEEEPFADDAPVGEQHPATPSPHPAHPAAPTHDPDEHIGQETAEYEVETEFGREPAKPAEEDVLEETPEFLQDTPDHDRLWFEQRPPRDFDFDG